MSLYSFFKAMIKYPCKLLYRVKVVGKENEPNGAYIVCANHSSFADPVIVTVCLKQKPRWVAKHDLKVHAFMRFAFRVTNAIPINREGLDTAALHECINSVKGGSSIGIFPQGTRMRKVEPEANQAHAGVALIACMSKATILPVSIVTKKRQPKMFRRTTLVIGKPITYEEYSNISEKPSKQEMTEYIFGKVCEPFKDNA